MRQFNKDKKIKLAHTPQITSEIIPLNAVGPSKDVTLRSLDFTPDDATCVFVSASTGSDTTGTGTATLPVAGITKALSLLTSSKTKIIITDSEEYSVENMDLSGNITGIYAADGEAPTVEPVKTFDYCMQQKYSSGIQSYLYSLGIWQLSNGNVLRAWSTDEGSGARKQYIAVYSNDFQSTVLPATGFENTTSVSVQVCSRGDYFYVAVKYNYSPGFHGIRIYKYHVNGTAQQIGDEDYIEFAMDDIYNINAMGILISGDIVIAFHNQTSGGDLILKRFSASGSLLNTRTICSGHLYDKAHEIVPLDNGNFVMTYTDALAGATYLGYYEENGVLINRYTLTGSDDYIQMSKLTVEEDEDEKVSVAYPDGSGYYRVREFTFTETSYTSRAIFAYNYPDNSRQSFALAPFGQYAICYLTRDPWQSFVRFYDLEGTYLGYQTFPVARISMYRPFFAENMFLYCEAIEEDTRLYAYNVVESFCIKNSVPVELNGLYIKGGNQQYLNFLLKAESSLVLRYCDVSFRAPRDGLIDEVFDRYNLYATGSVTVENCIIRDGHDIYIDADTVEFSHSQVYRLQGGITIAGAAASQGDILLDHCDVFNCYQGISFTGNSGNERITNSIIHAIAGVAVSAATTAQILRSVLTGSTSGITEVDCIRANPLYVNEGAGDPELIDLNIKIREMGYLATSPAYGLADSNKNAGALEVTYQFNETSRREILIPKESLLVDYKPVNPITQYRGDGSARFYSDGVSEIIEVAWDSLKKEDLDLVLAMLAGGDDSVFIYPEPFTHPAYYFEATLTWKSLAGSPQDYRQTDIGVNRGNSLVLIRKYEQEVV